MILSMSEQAQFFVLTVLLGAAVGIVYDCFRIIRLAFRHPDFLTQIEDLIYWLVSTLIIFYVILHRNNGEVRIYALLGVLLGMIIYFCTLSRLIMKISVTIINLVKKIIHFLITIVLFPFKLILKLLGYPARAIKKWTLKEASSGKKVLQKSGRYAKIRAGKVKEELYIIRRKV
jgi:spore cortex biosynthesis protein YabQ